MATNANRTNSPARPITGDVSRRLWFNAPVLIGSVLLALFLLSLAITDCTPPESNHVPPILLFAGTGTSPNDVNAVERILKESHLEYSTVNSPQLNAKSERQLRAYRLVIFPGGNYIDMGNGLAPNTTTNLRHAVQGGLNYLGICAGGLLAGNASCNSLNLTAGVCFGFYSAVNQGIHKTAVAIASPGSPPLEQYWENGPQFTGWGEVVGKYPDGTPAIVQGVSGTGWLVLSGIHAEAPERWRLGMTFTTPASDDNAYAGKLIAAALNRTLLPHY